MKKIIVLLVFLCLIFSFHLFYYTTLDIGEFDTNVLPELESLAEIMTKNQDKIFGKSKYGGPPDEVHISQADFNFVFKFLDDVTRKKYYDLYESKKILYIVYRSPCCIYFLVRFNEKNDFFQKAFEALYIIYENDCHKQVCHDNINGEKIPENKITLLKEHWYKVLELIKK